MDEPDVAAQGDPSSSLDLVPVFSAVGIEAEMEAVGIKSVLDQAGIPAILVGPAQIPSLPFEVQVPQSRLEEAQRVLEEARAAGSSAAEEAEAAGESSTS